MSSDKRYLLIPVEDIEGWLECNKRIYTTEQLANVELMKDLLKSHKPISFNEDDIDKKASKWVEENFSTGVGINVKLAYKQALTDLINPNKK